MRVYVKLRPLEYLSGRSSGLDKSLMLPGLNRLAGNEGAGCQKAVHSSSLHQHLHQNPELGSKIEKRIKSPGYLFCSKIAPHRNSTYQLRFSENRAYGDIYIYGLNR